jgi:hypothetical protein
METPFHSPTSRPRIATANWERLRRLQRQLAAATGAGGMLVSVLLSLAFARWLYSAAFLRGHGPFWQSQDGDIAQYIAGINAFVREPWQWPLLHISSINWPTGTLATFVDTVPLFALFLKLIHHAPLDGLWNPYGRWIMICYALQGVAAWWICREANLKSWVALAALTLLLASFPALSYRIHHTSLMSQWILLFGFAIYLRGTRLGRVASGPWIALVVCAFYINIYLFSMLSALFAADVMRRLRQGSWRAALLAPVAAYGLLGLTLFATMLPLGAATGAAEWGFGYYSMNLLAPFAGGALMTWPHAIANSGQGEGFNYLGVFLIALAVYAVRLRTRADRGFWSRHRPLLAILLLLVVYALSNAVYLGEALVLRWWTPGWAHLITGQLRASGRFFWPVGYAIVIFTVLTIGRHAGRRRAPLLLVLVTALQLWDLGPHHNMVRTSLQQASPALIDEARWNGFLGSSTDTLYFYPSFRCGKNPANDTMLPTMLYAAKHKMNLSTGYVARVAKPCGGMAAEIASARSPSAAFVFVRSEFAGREDVEKLMGGQAAATCIDADFAYLCKRLEPASTEKKQ